MRVAPQELPRILEGRKTQHRIPIGRQSVTRRTVKAGPRAEVGGRPHRVPVGPDRLSQPFEPEVGVQVPVTTGEGESAVVFITGVQRTTGVGAKADIRAQGWGKHSVSASKDAGTAQAEIDCKAAWIETHDRQWLNRQLARAEDLGRDPHKHVTNGLLALRYDQRWASVEVWVVDFVLDRDTVRSLAPVGRGDDRGYTRVLGLGLPGEPEAVDDRTLARYAKEALAADDAAARAELARARYSLRQAQVAASLCGVDLGVDVRAIERRIEKGILAKLNARAA